MANPEHLSIVKESPNEWNAWREAHPTVVPDLRDADLSEMEFSYIDLHDVDLRGADLTCSRFFFTDLQGANLSSVQASNVMFHDSVLHHTNLRFAQLPLSFFSRLQAHQADFTHAVLVNANCNSEADLSGSIFVDTDARGVNLGDANLSYTRLERTLFWGADLFHAYIQGASIHEVDFRYARLAGIDFTETANGNDFRHSGQFYEADLSHTRLKSCNLSGLDLQHARLKEADLTHAMLDAANLQGAQLQDANLHHASLRNTNLRGADLSGARLEGVDRTGADITDTRFFAVNRKEQQDV